MSQQAQLKKKKTHPRHKNKVYICKVCKEEYHPFSAASKYCSYKCMHSDPERLKRKVKKCPVCDKLFITHNGASQKKYCCANCYYQAIKKKPKKCPQCGREFLKNNRKYCSRECGYKGTKGMPKKKAKLKTQKLDEIWSKIIKLEAKEKCEYCGSTSRLNSHHIFSRSNYSVRWSIENGVCLCVKHHLFGVMSAHKAPIEFIEWLREKRGDKWYEDLRMKAKVITKLTKPAKLEIYEELKKKLSAYY